jgi:CRISPR/Cas system CMR subunit Cmr4 (Cas7 group RAMP superfamily)
MTIRHHVHLARFLLEAVTPLSISSGAPDGVFDTALVTDANGLPAIPGASLAGVLRHLFEADHGSEAGDRVFGYQRGNDGHTSPLAVAWGCILDSHGAALEGLALGEHRQRLEQDALLGPLLRNRDNPSVRDRVRIGPRGAAADHGKFDRTVLPAGYRFACELRYISDQDDDPAWPALLALLADPRLRLGGATRAGLGRVAVKRLHSTTIDLAAADGHHRLTALGAAIDAIDTMQAQTVGGESPLPPGWQRLRLHLKARDYWRIGQGRTPLAHYEKTPDALPVSEDRVIWKGHAQARIENAKPLLPASAVKGALAHRVAYYANCLRGSWAGDSDAPEHWDKNDPAHCPEVGELFGYSNDDDQGLAGRVIIDDTWVPAQPVIEQLMHNAIDRFTGGVRDRLLFSEELLWRDSLTLECLIHSAPLSDTALQTLQLALDDLLHGRLPLGAGGGRGHGRFDGRADPALSTDPATTEAP